MRVCSALLALATACLLASCAGNVELAAHLRPLPTDTMMLLGKKGMDVQAPIFVRIFKEESELEIWKRRDDGHFYHFMDQQTFDDIMLTEELIGADQLKYLKEGMECEGLVHNDQVILVELPNFVELAVTRTDPGVRGDTATGSTKPATLETGATVQVPLFIEEGQVIRVDRREDKYLTRV